MSGSIPYAHGKPLPVEVLRDYYEDFYDDCDTFIIDLVQEREVIGLDWELFNADMVNDLTVYIDNSPIGVLIPPNSVRSRSSIRFTKLEIVNSHEVWWNLSLAGVKVQR